MATEAFIKRISDEYNAKSPSIANLFRPFPDQSDNEMVSLCQSVSETPLKTLENTTKQILKNDSSFAEVVYRYLRYLASPMNSPSAFQNLFLSFNESIQVLQQGSNYYFFSLASKKLASGLTKLCLLTYTDSEGEYMSKTTSGLIKAINIGSTIDNKNSNYSPITYSFTNNLLHVLFTINNFRLIDRVCVMASRVPIDTRASRADRVIYRYYVGRTFLNRRELESARSDLSWAFENCTERNWKNRRIILVYLIAASLPLGIFPSNDLLIHYQLDQIFLNLISALKAGNFKQVSAELDNKRDWLLSKGIYLLLREKLELICWRNLARNVAFMSSSGSPQMSLNDLLTAAKIAMVNDGIEFDLDDMESICVSLLDQGYIKAYILHSRKILVLQKGPNRGFPPISSVQSIA